MTDDTPVDVPEMMPLSALNQFGYCPRRAYLIHAEGEFAENVHTLRGSHEHERVDKQESDLKEGVRVEYALPIWSRRLGLTGKCDAVEYHSDGTVYPVEHKHGKRRKWINDDLQLAAQAMCLEEMLGVVVGAGAVYHYQSRRRREVAIDAELRAAVEAAIEGVRAVLAAGRLPPPTDEPRKCRECSLREVCQPELGRAAARIREQAGALFSPEEEPA